jgi:hypothetical protein
LIQYGQSTPREYSFLSFTNYLQSSSYNRFPYEYKFLGLEFSLNKDTETTERATYGVLDFLGDIGGLAELLQIAVGWFLFRLSNMRLNALMINRLYHVSSTDSEMKNLLDRMQTSAGKNSNKLIKRPNGDIALGVPKFLDFEMAAFKIFFCC